MSRFSTMMRASLVAALALGLASAAVLVQAQDTLPPRMRGPVPAGPEAARLFRGQKAYVLANCHLCHGVTLAEARGGGADLAHSRVVEMDEAGSMISPVVRAGLPRTQTAMPRYPDMPQAELDDLVAYVHFMRQQLREKQALAAPGGTGNLSAGRAYFYANCSACHNGSKDLRVAAAATDQQLRAMLLRPAVARADAAADAPGRAVHLRLLESLEPADIDNLAAYLRQSGGRLSPEMAAAMVPPKANIVFRIERNCSVCHGSGGSGGERAPSLVNNANVAAFDRNDIKTILKQGLPGGMPAFAFSDVEIDEYVTWLKDHSATP